MRDGDDRDETGLRGVMRRHWISVSPRTAVRDALQLMRVARLRQLPVVADGVLLGVLSYRVLVEAAGAGDAERVEQVMSPETETADPRMAVAEAAARIARSPGGCLPVVEPGPRGPRLVGIVTEADLLSLAYSRTRGGTVS